MKSIYDLDKPVSYYKDITGLNISEIENIEEKEELVLKVFILWGMAEKSNNVKFDDEEFHDLSFVYKVLSRKLKVFNIDIKVPDYLYMLIDICVDSNPLKCQLVLHNIMMRIPNLKSMPGYVIKVNDFIRAYEGIFPIMAYPNLDKEYFRIAGLIKHEGRYACDLPSFWDQEIWSEINIE